MACLLIKKIVCIILPKIKHFYRTSKTFFKDDSGKVVPNPAPKFSRTPATIKSTSQPQVGQNSREVLEESGFSKDEIDHFVSSGIVLCSKSKL